MANKGVIFGIIAVVVVAAVVGGIIIMNNQGGGNGGEKTDTYTVTYDFNGGSSSIKDTNEYKNGDIVNIIFTPTPVREDYNFLGYDTSSTSTVARYTADGTKTLTISGSNVKLYAIWEKKIVPSTYSVTYNGNGGTTTIKDSNVYNPGDKVTVIFTPTPSKDKCDFLGWSENKNATTATYTESGTTSFTISKSTTLYAIWNQKLFTLSYDANGGTGTIPESADYSKGDVADVDFTAVPTLNGKSFYGWSTEKGAKTPTYDDCGIKTIEISKDTKLYAIYGEKRVSEEGIGTTFTFSYSGTMVYKGQTYELYGTQTTIVTGTSGNNVISDSQGAVKYKENGVEYTLFDLNQTSQMTDRSTIKIMTGFDTGTISTNFGNQYVKIVTTEEEGCEVIMKRGYYNDLLYSMNSNFNASGITGTLIRTLVSYEVK